MASDLAKQVDASGNGHKTPNPTLHVVFLAIYECLQQREKSRIALTAYSSDDNKPGPEGEAIAGPVNDIVAQEKALLGQLVALADEVGVAETKAGVSTSPVGKVRAFKPFRLAQRFVDPAETSLEHGYVLVSPKNGNIRDVMPFVTDGKRNSRLSDVAMDLLQYWELFLRHHVKLECSEFCDFARKMLLGRMTSALFGDAVLRKMPQTAGREFVATRVRDAETIRRAIDDSLAHVVDIFLDIEIYRAHLSKFSGHDMVEPTTNSGKVYARVVRRYAKHKSDLLSELFHLKDKVKKWLRVHGRSKSRVEREVDIVSLRPFVAASNFVNTLKHGVSAKKPSAVVEFRATIFDRPEGQAVSPDNHVFEVVEKINDGGELFSITDLMDDVIQLWELFLRNYTDIDTSGLRAEIGKRLLERQKLSTYAAAMPEKLEEMAKESAAEIKQLGF